MNIKEEEVIIKATQIEAETGNKVTIFMSREFAKTMALHKTTTIQKGINYIAGFKLIINDRQEEDYILIAGGN
jgi:hypothetical protein